MTQANSFEYYCYTTQKYVNKVLGHKFNKAVVSGLTPALRSWYEAGIPLLFVLEALSRYSDATFVVSVEACQDAVKEAFVNPKKSKPAKSVKHAKAA